MVNLIEIYRNNYKIKFYTDFKPDVLQLFYFREAYPDEDIITNIVCYEWCCEEKDLDKEE